MFDASVPYLLLYFTSYRNLSSSENIPAISISEEHIISNFLNLAPEFFEIGLPTKKYKEKPKVKNVLKI